MKVKDVMGHHITTIISKEDYEAHCRKNVLKNYRNKVTGPDKAPKLIDERRNGDRMTRNLAVSLNLVRDDGAQGTGGRTSFPMGRSLLWACGKR